MQNQSASLDVIRKQLIRRCETLGVAESVTSGNLQAAFSLAKESTGFFQGGITLYNTAQKTRHLDIDPINAERTNCVSEDVAVKMASGTCRLFCCDWGIAITGYASPVPEWDVVNNLFAYFAVSFRGERRLAERIELQITEMEKAQHHYVQHVLSKFAGILT